MKISKERKALLEFAIRLVRKGRSPREIYGALRSRTEDKVLIEEVVGQAFSVVEEGGVKSQKVTMSKELLTASRTKLNFEYAVKNSLRIPMLLLVMGIIVLKLSNKEVNGNAVYGWFTLAQGGAVFILFGLVRWKNMQNLLLPAAVFFVCLYLVELTLFQLPNYLLAGIEFSRLKSHPGLHGRMSPVGGGLVSIIFPYLYTVIKIALCWIVARPYLYQRKMEALSESIKEDLRNLK